MCPPKVSSNNTNKLSPQEQVSMNAANELSSNNTNKLSPQEQRIVRGHSPVVQIIQINLVLKNRLSNNFLAFQFK